jgi:hypothetical protein
MVSPENLVTWGISFDELFETGLAKLRKHTIPKFEKQQGFHIGGWHDDYDNSRILIPEVFGPLHLDVTRWSAFPTGIHFWSRGLKIMTALRR